MLWVDKYRPTTLAALDCHASLTERLRRLAHGDMPHLLVYGPPGAGKKTRVACVLHEIYGAGAAKVKVEHKAFALPNRSEKLELVTLASAFHIEMTPSDAGYHDKRVVQDVIKEIAQSRPLDASHATFKVLVLNDVDRLSKEAQHGLRRTMERYMSGCRLVLLCNSTSKVIGPLRSRCLGVRVPAPSDADVCDVMQRVCKREGLTLPDALATRVAAYADGNLRKALLQLEALKVRQYPFAADAPLELPDWERYVVGVASDVLHEQTPTKLLAVRAKLYELLAHCIPPELILRRLLAELLRKLDSSLHHVVAAHAADYEHRMTQGSKAIFHLEAFIANFMAVYKKYLLQAAGAI